MTAARQPFNIMIVAQAGRLQYEALLMAASLRANAPGFSGRLIVAEPQPGPRWPTDPRLPAPFRDALADLAPTSAPLKPRLRRLLPPREQDRGPCHPPPGEPFLFLDTDTLILSDISAVPFDFARPTASMRREGTWPVEDLYWPGYTATWKSLYDRFGLDFASSLDLSEPDEYWQRYLYFNAGWFLGPDPAAFGARFTDWALSVRNSPPPELALQPLDPWLDQVVLPLVIHSFGGGRPGPELAGLDGDATCHYRTLPLLYARESDRAVEVLESISAPNRVKKLLKEYAPFRKMIYQGGGAEARAMFDRRDLPRQEQVIRNRLRAAGLWLR